LTKLAKKSIKKKMSNKSNVFGQEYLKKMTDPFNIKRFLKISSTMCTEANRANALKIVDELRK